MSKDTQNQTAVPDFFTGQDGEFYRRVKLNGKLLPKFFQYHTQEDSEADGEIPPLINRPADAPERHIVSEDYARQQYQRPQTENDEDAGRYEVKIDGFDPPILSRITTSMNRPNQIETRKRLPTNTRKNSSTLPNS